MSAIGRIAVSATAVCLATGAAAVGVPGQGTWEQTLLPRDLDRDGQVDAYYDAVLHVTWLKDFDVLGRRGGPAAGRVTWQDAMAFAAAFTIGTPSHQVTGWRLPKSRSISFNHGFSTNGSTDDGYAMTGIGWGEKWELGHLYYVTLANRGYCTPQPPPMGCVEQAGWGLLNTGPFQNMRAWNYFSATLFGPLPDQYSWSFDLGTGRNGWAPHIYLSNVALLHDGDVGAPIPEPTTALLLSLGIATLLGMRRSRADASQETPPK